ncbi:MAG: diaminopimelate epimerase [Candidatus Cryptobacteroides sp.]
MELYKYQGAGNDFLIADNRDSHISVEDGTLVCHQTDPLTGNVSEHRVAVSSLCDRRYGVGADGLMLLENVTAADSADCGNAPDFRMVYFNSDGSGGMMCGNGGRCIVAFAADLGITHFDFVAADGPHSADVLIDRGKAKTVRLKMKDVSGMIPYTEISGFFLDTGTRHFVKPVTNLAGYDVVGEGRRIRYMEEFAPIGTNVNFIEPSGDVLNVRTYEKGVEDETFACGTGITASAIIFWHLRHILPDSAVSESSPVAGRVNVKIRALKDSLSVDFIPTADGAKDVWLTGPATFVCKVILD